MLEIKKEQNKKKCIWVVTVVMISLFSCRYVMFAVGELTDIIVGNNVFLSLLVLMIHILLFIIMGSTCFQPKKSIMIGIVSILFVCFLKKYFWGELSLALVTEAGIFLFFVGHVCSYFIKQNIKIFLLFSGEGALFLMHYFVPVLDACSIAFFSGLVAVAFLKIHEIFLEPEMKIFTSTKAKILFCLLDIYASFAMIGHNAFFKNPYYNFTFKGIIAYILCLFIMYPLLMLLTYGTVKIRLVIKRIEKTDSHFTGIWVQIKCFLFMIIPLFVMSLGFYPAAMTSDGLWQWCLVTGVYPIDDSHPAIHTLFLKACSLIAKTPYMVVIVHIFLFSLIWSFVFKHLYQNNRIKEITLYLTAFLISIFPNNHMMLFLISKNTLYALIVLCTTYLFMKLYLDEFFLNWKTIFLFGVDLAFLYLVRHNGFVGTIVACCLLIGLAVYKLIQGKWLYCTKLCLIVAVMLGSIVLIKGPIYSHFQVIQNRSSVYIGDVLAQPVGMYYLADKDIPNEVKDTVDYIGTKEQWLNYYNPYHGDKLAFSEFRDLFYAIDKNEMFKMYFTLLKDDPLLVIKTRLNAIDMLWNIVEPTESYSKYHVTNGRYASFVLGDKNYIEFLPDLFKEEYKMENGNYGKPNQITKLCECINNISYKNSICDSIFWRNGIYFVVLFLLFIINGLEEHKEIILAGLVPLAVLGSLALAASWPIYQYYYFFPLCVFFLMIMTFASNAEYTGQSSGTDESGEGKCRKELER